MSFDPLVTHSPGWYLIVDPEGHGERLDRFITRRLQRVSRSRAAKLNVYLLDHRGTVQIPLKKSTRLKNQQSLWIERPTPKENIQTLEQPNILDECEDFLVVNKPKGWVAHPTANRFYSAITTWLKHNHYDAQPVHRLDCETSGLLICAKHRQAERELQKAFIQQKVHKTYLGICQISNQGQRYLDKHGPKWLENTALGFDTEGLVNIKMGRGNKTASTKFQVISTYSSQPGHPKPLDSKTYALIKATPHSGRQHQIRVHLSLAGLSLVGDKLYGPNENYFLKHLAGELTGADYQKLGHDRHALHAASLSFSWQGQQKSWQSPLPQDLKNLLQSMSFIS